MIALNDLFVSIKSLLVDVLVEILLNSAVFPSN